MGGSRSEFWACICRGLWAHSAGSSRDIGLRSLLCKTKWAPYAGIFRVCILLLVQLYGWLCHISFRLFYWLDSVTTKLLCRRWLEHPTTFGSISCLWLGDSTSLLGSHGTRLCIRLSIPVFIDRAAYGRFLFLFLMELQTSFGISSFLDCSGSWGSLSLSSVILPACLIILECAPSFQQIFLRSRWR